MTETLLESTLTTNTSCFPESYVIPLGLAPTVIIAEMVLVVAFITEIEFASLFVTNISPFAES